MTTINKSAQQIGIIEFKSTGLRNTLHMGTNSNTGETIIWQQVAGRRAQRITGRNIAHFAYELNSALNEGVAVWIERNDTLVDALRKYL